MTIELTSQERIQILLAMTQRIKEVKEIFFSELADTENVISIEVTTMECVLEKLKFFNQK